LGLEVLEFKLQLVGLGLWLDGTVAGFAMSKMWLLLFSHVEATAQEPLLSFIARWRHLANTLD